MAGRVKHITRDSVTSFLSRYTTFLFDCDGVIWSNDMISKIDGVSESIQKLRNANKNVYFMSNNPGFTKEQFQERFRRLGGFETPAEDIVNVCDATGSYLKDILKVKGKVFCLADHAMQQALTESGLRTCVPPQEADPIQDIGQDFQKLLDLPLEADVEAVVVSNFARFNYTSVFLASNYLQNRHCGLYVVNKDKRFWIGPQETRRMLPVCGTIAAAVEAGSGREATVIGKPSPIFFDSLKIRHPNIDPARTVMVGDLLSSDIQFANNCNIDSVLVCTGVDNEDTLKQAQEKDPAAPCPNYILQSVGDLAAWM